MSHWILHHKKCLFALTIQSSTVQFHRPLKLQCDTVASKSQYDPTSLHMQK